MATLAPPVDGGDSLGAYSWSQVLTDLTVTVPLAERAAADSPDGQEISRQSCQRLCGADVGCDIAAQHLRVTLWPCTPRETVVVDADLTHTIVPAASEYSLTDDVLTIDLEKRVEGFWDRLFESDRKIDIRTLGPAVGEVGKVHDPNEPQKIEDPEAISRVVKEHPELVPGLAHKLLEADGAGAAAGEDRGNGKMGAAEALVTQTATSATYHGASAFEW